MKKKLVGFFVIVVVVLIIAVVVAIPRLGGMIKAAVETQGPKVLGVPVELEAAKVEASKGKVQLTGLAIGNPEGFNSPSLFKLGDVQVDMKVKSISTDKIEIDSVLIDAPEITYEKSLTSSNIKKLMDHLSSGKPKAQHEQEKKEGKPAKQVVINDLIIRNAKVEFSMKLVGNASTPPAPLTLGEIHLTDLGGELGSGEIATVVLGAIMKGLGQAAVDSQDLLGDYANVLTEDVLGKGIGEATKLVGGAGKVAIDTAEGAVEGATKAITDTTKKLTGGLGGLLGGGKKKEEE